MTSDFQKMSGDLRQSGCPVCRKVLDPEKAVRHPQGGLMHPECREFLSFKVGGRSGRIDLDSDGAGYAEYEE